MSHISGMSDQVVNEAIASDFWDFFFLLSEEFRNKGTRWVFGLDFDLFIFVNQLIY